MIYAFQQKLDKASDRQLRQLDFISQFSTDIMYVKGENNIVADALSRINSINSINMPTPLDSRTIQQQQELDEELTDLIEKNSSLKLQKLTIEPDVSIYCDIATGVVRPYIPGPLRKQAFDSVHGLAHPNGKITSHHLKQKYILSCFSEKSF